MRKLYSIILSTVFIVSGDEQYPYELDLPIEINIR